MVIFHTLVLAGLVPSKLAKPLASLIWFTLTAGFLIVILLAAGVYYATWTCDQPVIPTIRLADHFNYNYGFVYACVGFLSALLVFVVTVTTFASNDAAPAPKALP